MLGYHRVRTEVKTQDRVDEADFAMIRRTVAREGVVVGDSVSCLILRTLFGGGFVTNTALSLSAGLSTHTY